MTVAILLLGLGLAFVIAEVFFPSFGVLSILATVSIVAAIVFAFRESTDVGFNFLLATMVLLPVTILGGFKLFPRSPMGKHMVAGGLSFDSTAATDPRDLELAGVVGRLESDCRPTGVARLAGRRVDVVTRGEWIEEGEEVRVLEVRGNRVVVASVAASETDQGGAAEVPESSGAGGSSNTA